MAFDFGAFLSSVGQVAPAMSEGAEIRRQRAADAAAVSQQAQAAQDTHEARQAQTAREQSLTKLDERNATRLTPLSSKPERGQDGKYYMLFAGPDGKPMRLPVDGDYDPKAEQRALLKELNIPEDSDLGKQVMLGIKPTNPKMQLKQNGQTGEWEWITEPGTGLPSSASPNVAAPAGQQPQSSLPVIPTGLKGRMPSTGSTTSHVYHWPDNAGNMHEYRYDTSTRKTYGDAPPTGVRGIPGAAPKPSVAPSGGGGKAPSVPPRFTGLMPGDKIIGTGKLPATANRIVITTQPVIDQTSALIKRIDDLGLANNNDSYYLAKPYFDYRFRGKASDPGSLGSDIAGLSLGSVVDAASALAGSSRSVQALKLAMVHTPNVAIDSPKLLREKLVTINSRLQDIVRDAQTGGGTSPGNSTPQDTIKNFVKPPSSQQSAPEVWVRDSSGQLIQQKATP